MGGRGLMCPRTVTSVSISNFDDQAWTACPDDV
ncbi:hypothetical protein MICRO116_860003 [Micrococcus sp. 116]|nr:hypothetical protein MICRO116_860003 [Micrococcus sp. 116]